MINGISDNQQITKYNFSLKDKALKLLKLNLGAIASAHIIYLIIYVASLFITYQKVLAPDSSIFTITTHILTGFWHIIATNVAITAFAIYLIKNKLFNIKLTTIFFIINAIIIIIEYNWPWLVHAKFNFIAISLSNNIHFLYIIFFGIIPAVVWITYLLVKKKI